MSAKPAPSRVPLTLATIEWLRRQLVIAHGDEAKGRAHADRLLREGRAGQPVCYFAELCADGVVREFGASPSGRRWQLVDGVPQWVASDA